MNENEVKKLYTALINKGFSANDIGDENTFVAKMGDQNARKQFYDAISKTSFRIGDYDTFEKRLTSSEQVEQPALTPDSPLSQEERAGYLMQGMVGKRNTSGIVDDFSAFADNMREYGDKAPVSQNMGQSIGSSRMFNPESGKMEKTYVTPSGSRYNNKNLADFEVSRYREAADMTVNGQLRRARAKLEELQAKKADRTSEVHDEAMEFNESKLTGLGQMLVGGDIYVAKQRGDSQKGALDVAIRQTEELIKDLEEQKDRDKGVDVGFWRGVGRTMGDSRTWDFGIGNMGDAITMLHSDKLADENATEGEKDAYNEMMSAIYNKEQADRMYGDNRGFWYKAGVTTGYMPSFMIDFIATGGGFKGLNLLSKGGAKAATKIVGKEISEEIAEKGFKQFVKDNGVKGFMQYGTDWTVKALGTMGDDLLFRAPMMANTVQFGKTASDIIDRKLGDVVVNEDGSYDFANDETWSSAIWQGEANAIVENYSEMFGGHLGQVVDLGKLGKLANVIGAKRLGNILTQADAGSLGGIMGQTQRLFKEMGVGDYFGEVTEEFYGQLWRTVLNLDDAYIQNPDGTRTNLFATSEFYGDVLGGMALSMGLMGAAKTTYTGARYASAKHNVNKADKHAAVLFGDEWEGIRATIDNTTNDNMGTLIQSVLAENYSTKEMNAILSYMESSMVLRGFNLGTLARSRGEQNEVAQQVNESYLDGYNASTPQEMNDAQNTYDLQREKALLFFTETELETIANNPVAHIDAYSGEHRDVLLDYINAKQVRDGMIQRVRDDIDSRIEESNTMVDSRTNTDTGMIQGATMKVDDRKVYIIKGSLVQYDDKSGINNSASSESVIIRDAQTGKIEIVSPDAILNIDDAIDPNEEKATAAEVIRTTYAQAEADKMEGKVTFNPGDTYTLDTENGKIQVQITANEQGIVDNGDGTINVTDGQHIFPVTKQTFQDQVDAANKARVAQYDALRQAERSMENTPEYALNDKVVLRDANGNTINGQIAEVFADDGYYIVDVDVPINGNYVIRMTRDELNNMLVEYNGVNVNTPSAPAQQAQSTPVAPAPSQQAQAPAAPQSNTALSRIPKDAQGNPIYEQTDADTAWDAIVEQTEGDETMAQSVAESMLKDKQTALSKAEKMQVKGGATIAEKIAAEKERKAIIANAQREVELWQQIAGTVQRRQAAAEVQRKIEVEKRRIAEEAAAQQAKVEEEQSQVQTNQEELVVEDSEQEVADVAPESEEKIDDSTITEQETPVQAEEQVQSEESPAESQVTEQAETPTSVQPKESKKAKKLRNRAEKWMKDTGVTVRLLHSIDEVTNNAARAAIEAGNPVSGWFSNNEVVLYMPNINSVEEIDKTFIHEVVAHKGLRMLMGERFDALCDNVWDMMSEEDRAKYIKYPGVKGNTRKAADEYMAYLAEGVDLNKTIWQKIIDAVREFFSSKDVTLLDEEIANLIKESYKNLKAQAATNVDNEVASIEGQTMFRVANNNQEIFVSNARKAVESIKQEKATPEQWLAMLQKNGGLKAGEDKWMGLSDWLKESKSKTLSKEDLLNFINENSIKIEEVKYGNAYEGIAKDLEYYWGDILEEAANNVQEKNDIDDVDDLDWDMVNIEVERIIKNKYGDNILDYISYDEKGKFSVIDSNASQQTINNTRAEYITKGLNNNQEIALVVPTIESWNNSDEIHFGDAGDGRAIAWIRFGQTTDEEGNHVLVVDEIQSKRHQDGREKGYRSDAKIAELKSKADSLVAEQEQIAKDILHKQGYIFHDEEIGRFSEKHEYDALTGRIGSQEQMARQKEIDSELYVINHELRGLYNGIPDAPFEKNWHELAFKRMLRLAAEEGFDKVAWTTGEQQAQRYNLSKVFKSIEREDNPNINGRRFILSGGNFETFQVDENGQIIDSSITEAKGKSLADVVGKDMSLKMMSLENGDMLEGEQLQIGGEGMKSFYDKILPSFVSKYVKKWGSKVGEVTMPSLRENNTMWSVDITPEMQESVMEGQTMFRISEEEQQIIDDAKANGTYLKAPNGKATKLTPKQWVQVRTKAFKKWFGDWIEDSANASKIIDENGEPMVVYHDTNSKIYRNVETGEIWDELDWRAREEWKSRDDWDKYWREEDFYSFNNKKGRRSIEMPAFFFTPNYDEYHEFGDRNIAAFLNIRNPKFNPTIKDMGVTDTAGEDAMNNLIEEGYDGFIQTEDGQWYETNAFFPNQIKSATENEGTFNPEDNDIRFRISEEQDKAYIDAVEAGDMETAQAMVDSAAQAAGYNSPRLYHGTKSEFNVFNAKHNDPGSKGFFFTDSEEMASSYGKNIKQVYLRVEDPYVIEGNGRNWNNLHTDIFSVIPEIEDQIRAHEIAMKRFLENGDIKQSQYDYFRDKYYNKVDFIKDESKNTIFDIIKKYIYRWQIRNFNSKLNVDRTRDFEWLLQQLDSDVNIIFKDITDYGANITDYESIFVPHDVYVTTNPKNIKSADAVTYDDNGNVVPLSERFNDEEDDVRFRVSTISPEMDAEYLSAVEKGDNKTVQRMVLESAKLAMPNTKVVDRKGNPKVVYHGTPSDESFNVFDLEKAGMVFLTSSQSVANQYTHNRIGFYSPIQTGRIIPLFANIQNPLIINANKRLWRNIKVDWSDNPVNTRDIALYAKENGYDGVIIEKVRDNIFDDDKTYSDVYIAFNPSQVKNAGSSYKTTKRDYFPFETYERLTQEIGATYDDKGNVVPLSERFNEDNDDIRFRVSEAKDKIKEIIGADGSSNKSIYAEGKTESGEKWVIRVSDHPAKIENFKDKNEDADYILSIIIDEDFDSEFAHKWYHSITNDENTWQVVVNPKNIDYDVLSRGIDRFKRTGDGSLVWDGETETMFRIRTEAPPKKTGIGYKVFVLKDGKLYPPMVANPNGEATPVGVWLDADAAPIAGQSKTGRSQVKAGGKGTQGGSGKLAYRPGWHLGEIPYALQFARKDENGERTLFPANFVWAEVEYSNDVDYQEEAMSYGYNKNGKFQHSYAGLPRVPENGAYRYRTNPNPETDEWIISGAMKVNRLLTPTEVDEMVKEVGREPQRRQDGAVTDEQIKSLNEEFETQFRIRQITDKERQTMINALSLSEGEEFYDNVFNGADQIVRENIVAIAAKNGWDFRKATEEYLGSLADNNPRFDEVKQIGLWDKVKGFFVDMLNKIGLNGFTKDSLADNDLRYILWRRFKNPKGRKDLFEKAEDIAKQYELGVGDYAEKDDTLFRTSSSIRDRYDRAVRVPNKSGSVKWHENSLRRLKEAYYDGMHALKKLQDLIAEETGKPIQSYENSYEAENHMSSENKAQAEIFERDFFNPLKEVVQSLIKLGSSYEKLKTYIIAKHGLERNAYMRNKAVQNGENGDRDFSGLTDLTGIKNVADAEIDAQRIVDEYEKKYDTTELWEKINAATKETLRKSYDSGLISKETYEEVRDMYKYYIPLRGWDIDVASDEYEYLNSGRIMLSPALNKAKGRTSLADDPLATIGFMAESTIIQGNRNKVKMKFLNMALNHPTNLISVSEQWYVLDNATGEWEPRNPIIPDGATGDQVAAIVEQHEQQMIALGDKATKIKDGLKLNKNITKREGQEHVVRVKRNGKEYCLYINGSPRAAQAINGLLNPDINNSGLKKVANAIKHWMAAMFTSKNPTFIFLNLSRDVIWAGTSVAIKENAAYNARYTKNIAECLLKAQLPRLLKKFQNGTLDMNNELERYFDEFIRNGGETGFTQLHGVDDYKRNINRFVKEAQGKGFIGKKTWDGMIDNIEFLNRCAEDTTRFMVYMTSRQLGRDVMTSVTDAKEVTVNFNRKGSGGLGASLFNFCYLFFNASIQSAANFGKLLVKHPKKSAIALTLFSSAGFLVPMLNMAIRAMFSDDEDDNSYWDLPEWIRRNNIVLYVPWTESGYLTIPVPHELRPFYGMGEIAFSCLMGKEDVEDGLKKASLGFTQLIPLDFTGNGGNFWVNITPTIGQPIAQIITNKDYFGKPIYKKNDWNERSPEWTKAYKSTTPWLIDAAKWLNEISGGDNVKKGKIDLNPALIEHIFESYTGGVGKTLNNAQKTFAMLWNEDLREWRNVPIVGSFYRTTEEQTAGSQINREYYEAIEEMKDVQHLINGYNRELRMGNLEYAEKINELINSEIFKRYGVIYEFSNAIKEASDYLKLIDDATDREKIETAIMNFKVNMFKRLEDINKAEELKNAEIAEEGNNDRK